MNKFISKFISILLVFILSGCATLDSSKDKINTIAKEEVKKEYILPFLNECSKLEDLNDLTFESLFKYGKLLREQYKICNQYNQEKLEWLQRNFPEEIKK